MTLFYYYKLIHTLKYQSLKDVLKLAKIFSEISDNSTAYKNHLIAKALLAVIYSNETTKEKRRMKYLE